MQKICYTFRILYKNLATLVPLPFSVLKRKNPTFLTTLIGRDQGGLHIHSTLCNHQLQVTVHQPPPSLINSLPIHKKNSFPRRIVGTSPKWSLPERNHDITINNGCLLTGSLAVFKIQIKPQHTPWVFLEANQASPVLQQLDTQKF